MLILIVLATFIPAQNFHQNYHLNGGGVVAETMKASVTAAFWNTTIKTDELLQDK